MSRKRCPFLDKECMGDMCAVFRNAGEGECALLAVGNYAASISVHTLETFKQLGGEVTKKDNGGLHLEAKPERITQ